MFSTHLPQVYQQNKGAQYFFTTADSLAVSISKKVSDLRTFLDPDLTTDEGLNFIASNILDLKSWFWSDNWSLDWKRKVIKSYPKLIKERGNKSLIPWLFTLFGLDIQILSSGWILNVSTFPITFGTAWDQLTLKIPVSYTKATPQYQMLQAIIKWFIPDLITVTIQN